MKLLVAGGGTGGHIFPGIAVAEELTTRAPNNEVVFVGTQQGIEAKVVPQAGFRLCTIPSRGLKRVGFWKKLWGFLLLPFSFLAAWGVLRREKPDFVLGVGGYSSGPLVLTAVFLRIPTAIQEQNAAAGVTNRILGRFVKAVFLAFEQAAKDFSPRKIHVVGNPVRRKLFDNYLRSSSPHPGFNILVFGGSMGARGINLRMREALAFLEDLKGELHFVHQTGKNDLSEVQTAYEGRQFSAEVLPFIDDMSSVYARSELIICRAGAVTLAELTVCKKPSILIPFPYAADDHQTKNARAMEEAGAAIVFLEAELTGECLAAEIRALVKDAERRLRMERCAGLMGRPEAAKELVDMCIGLTYGKKKWLTAGESR
ncbi:MAG: undecaprenyldiphospho-muramoylpentapeptide beta-N-acetylglucosaminyltransferase [Proteobacteria bacterium]|nr:undecaprenyldiphospho-muramoylpentapeptide beta-N-acetylglucosaminyltransferase [Cystobacterineae bacterium]MCL2258733.1 undecaprenyldiphospho-muramoylpentapeptide beta-N-acetylglucosaminyltransferase [Cystobacterineae bacterium]MCL2314281.1 undecaprenyldiphospho-muramoylpentapeptide beta-N-acetylglucosaminyltransferase [Pseudomonadota bacterium]